MDLEEFLGQENINNFEKLLLVYLQFRSFKSYKDLEPVFKVSGVTIRKAIANLRKLGLLNNYDPVKLSFRCKEIFTHENAECKESFTYKNDTCKENLTPCKEMFTSDSDRCKEKFTSCKENFTFSKNDPYIYNTNSININISNINKEEGKSSLTSFASTSLKYYIDKFDFVNDPDHRNINQIQNSLIPTEPAKTSLAEIVKAPAKRTRAKKTVENFKPPSSSEEVEIFMQSYVEKSLKKYPYLIYVDIQRSADDFLSYYTMNNWKQSKNKPIVDWKAAAEKWLRNQQDYIKKGTAEPKQLNTHEQELFDRLTNNQQIDEQRFNNAVDVSEGDSECFTQVQAFEHKETPEEYAERQRREIEEYRRTLYED